MNRERRKEKRINEENRVRIELPGAAPGAEGSAVNAFTQDISLGGAKIITDTGIEVGSEIKLIITLSRTKNVVKLRAVVRWVKQIETGIYELGIEFQHGVPASVLTLINHLYGKEKNA